jgi:Tfp pilus assembly protein PilE
MTMVRFWPRGLARERGFTLVELMILVAVIGFLCGIVIPRYSNMQSRARVAQAHADLRSLYSALVAFSAQCGDVPNSDTSATAPATIDFATDGEITCVAAVPDGLEILGNVVLDASNLPAGPFHTTALSPPTGWTYSYISTGPEHFTIVGSSPSDMPGGDITLLYPPPTEPAGDLDPVAGGELVAGGHPVAGGELIAGGHLVADGELVAGGEFVAGGDPAAGGGDQGGGGQGAGDSLNPSASNNDAVPISPR